MREYPILIRRHRIWQIHCDSPANVKHGYNLWTVGLFHGSASRDLNSTWPLSPPVTSETNLIVKSIQKNDFLSRLDEEQTAMMVHLLVVSDYKPGQEVIKEGTEGDSMYIVAGGDTCKTQLHDVLRL